MGRYPEPTAKLRLTNSRVLPRRKNEPKVEALAPDPPHWLCKMAREIWRDVVPKLDAIGVLSTLDGNALGRYCETYARWIEATAFVQQNGTTYPVMERGKDGKERLKMIRKFPQVNIANEAAQQLHVLELQFGLTPSARTRLQVTEKMKSEQTDDTQDKARFFGGA